MQTECLEERDMEQDCDEDIDILERKRKVAKLFEGQTTSSYIDDLCGPVLFAQ